MLTELEKHLEGIVVAMQRKYGKFDGANDDVVSWCDLWLSGYDAHGAD